ncbi:MAG: PDZ domain-containing protein [Pedobacter sp.]|nr:MAG: PDZ domain-containing protein [Pedobacter sp.]
MFLKTTFSFSLLILISFKLLALDPVTIYVAKSGKPGSAGTKDRPFSTLSLAVKKAVTLKNKNVTINIAKGIYYLDETLKIHSVSFRAASLIIQGAIDGKTVISAGRKLQLSWTRASNGIMSASVPKGITFERLYINTKLQTLARYPNFDAKERFYNGTAADAISPQRVAGWNNPAGGYLHGLHSGEWGSFDFRISGKNSANKLALEGGYQNNRQSPLHEERRFVENIFEELDAPGEWYLDREKSVLYYYPIKGIELKTALIEVSRFKNTIELLGTVALPLKNISLQHLTFMHNERSFMDTKEPLLRSDWTMYRGGAVLLDGTENANIVACKFQGLGGNAIVFSNYNLSGLVQHCHIFEIGASAVSFVGSAKAVRSPLFNYDEHQSLEKIDMKPGPLSKDYPQRCSVDNNLFHNLGELEKQATGVQIAMSSEISVTYNSIYHTPRAGINIGDGCWGGHEIANNDVFETVLETGDHGAFNSWGRDRFWDPSSNYHIYNNVCLNGGLKLREGFHRIVENNIMVNNSFHPHVWFKSSGDVFRYNIVMQAYAPISMNYWGKEINNNIFLTESSLKKSQALGNDMQSIYGNPQFVDPIRGNFQVRKASNALDVGFRNFSHVFGVQYASLKKLARSPVISPLRLEESNQLFKVEVSLLGGVLTSVQGLGDRSAYGLPDENGVIVLKSEVGSSLFKSGIFMKDVILSIQGKQVKNVNDFIAVLRARDKSKAVTVQLMRAQKKLTVNLLLEQD